MDGGNYDLNLEAETDLDIDPDNLSPEVRLGVAIYLTALNEGIVTEQGVLLPNALNLVLLSKQAEISPNFGMKLLGNIRRQGFIKNRKSDGRLLIKLQELEEWLRSNGAAVE